MKEVKALDSFMRRLGYKRNRSTFEMIAGEGNPAFNTIALNTAIHMYNSEWKRVRYADGFRFVYKFPKSGEVFEVYGVNYLNAQLDKEYHEVPVLHLSGSRRNVEVQMTKKWPTEVNPDRYLDRWMIVGGAVVENYEGGETFQLTDEEFLMSNLVEGGWMHHQGKNYWLGKKAVV